MDPQLLDYYNRELVYLRELASEFASQHPKVAKRLGMHGHEVADPYVERLIEAFCFLSARTQIKLDAEFPRFTQRLLEVIYPNYVTPTPAMAVAQFHPSEKQGDFARGVIVPRGTTLKARIPDGETTAYRVLPIPVQRRAHPAMGVHAAAWRQEGQARDANGCPRCWRRRTICLPTTA